MAASEFLGRGWKFPVQLEPTGEIATVAYEEDIREALRIILGTAPGERLMRPTFGCGIHHMVFATLSMATLGQVETAVREALLLWEPRVEVEAVTVSVEEAQVGHLLIGIDYRVRSTNNRFNLVYPFYLKEQG
ncbi:MAG: GPW/gp25 family protein [Candidatus Tectimicrobiota bacterium]